MRRYAPLLLCLFSVPLFANAPFHGWCEQGGQNVFVQGIPSVSYFQQSYPNFAQSGSGPSVTVYYHNTLNKATLFSDNIGTPLGNPFPCSVTSEYTFYASNNVYDVTISGSGLATYTFTATVTDGCPTNATCDAQYDTLAHACSAAGNGTLFVTAAWNGLSTQSFGCVMRFLAKKGSVQPASGQVLTFLNCPESDPFQIFDISLSGSSGIAVPSGCSLYAEYFGAAGDGSTNDTTALTAAFGMAGDNLTAVSGKTYNCGNSALLSNAIVVMSSSVNAAGSSFTGGCIFTTAGASGGLTWTGGTIDTTAISGTGGSPVILVTNSHTVIDGVHFKYTKNYTAVQICFSAPCPSDVKLSNIETTANGESHITTTGVSGLVIANWVLDGTGGESGLALLPNTGTINGVAVTGVTATNTFDILQIAPGPFTASSISLVNWTCNKCFTALETQDGFMPSGDVTGVTIGTGNFYDAAGVAMSNVIQVQNTTAVNLNNFDIGNITAYGCFRSAAPSPIWGLVSNTGTGILSNWHWHDLVLTQASGCGSGNAKPQAVIAYVNTTNAVNQVYENISANGSTSYCLAPGSVASQTDLIVRNNYFINCNSGSSTTPAHNLAGNAIWYGNTTVLNANQPEINSVATHPLGVPYSTLTGTTFNGAAEGTSVFCYDCTSANPTANSGGGALVTKLHSGSWSGGVSSIQASGNWTPVVNFGGAAVGQTYSAQAANYAETGNQVSIFVSFTMTAKGSSTGIVSIAGLPVGAGTGNFVCSPVAADNVSSISSGLSIQAKVISGTIYLYKYDLSGSSGIAQLTDANFNNNTDMQFSCSYHT